MPKVGDEHGVMRVTRIAGRIGHRSEIRVECTCTVCGYRSEMYEHNMYTPSFGKRCTHQKGGQARHGAKPHRLYDEIEVLTREERRELFDRLLDNFCFDTGTLDGRPCGEFADEECQHTARGSSARVKA